MKAKQIRDMNVFEGSTIFLQEIAAQLAELNEFNQARLAELNEFNQEQSRRATELSE